MSLEVVPLRAAETHPLRQAVLRPNQPADALFYPGDDAPDTLHFGARLDGRIVCIASVYREAPAGEQDATAWRLRGMATAPELRRSGAGKAVLQDCIEAIRAAGGKRLWCNARATAVPFYLSLDFEIQGEEFELPNLGPHRLMSRPV